MAIQVMFSVRYVQALLITIFCTIGFTGITSCAAQSIIGKWKGVSAMIYYSAEYAKESGKSTEERTAKETGNSTVDYKADHSFVMTFSPPTSKEITTMNGTWALNSDQLTMKLEPKFNPRQTSTTATIAIQGNTMLMTAVIPAPSRISKTISTCTRM